MDKEIHRNKYVCSSMNFLPYSTDPCTFYLNRLILDRFEDRLSRASLINSSNLSNDRQRKEAYTADV
jgi:hypothetical protein